MRKLLYAFLIFALPFMAEATNRTQITTLGPNDPANLLVFNTNFINLRATADAIYNDAGTPLNTNLFLWTNSISGIRNLIGYGGGYITNFAEIWVGTQRVSSIVVGTGSVDSASVARWDSNYTWYAANSNAFLKLDGSRAMTGNLNLGSKAITNTDYLIATNYISTGERTNIFATVGSVRLPESTSTDQAIWFGDDVRIYRDSIGRLKINSVFVEGNLFAQAYYGAYLGDFTNLLYANNACRWIWQGGVGFTNYMTLTNNAGIGQLEVGNMLITNILSIGAKVDMNNTPATNMSYLGYSNVGGATNVRVSYVMASVNGTNTIWEQTVCQTNDNGACSTTRYPRVFLP